MSDELITYPEAAALVGVPVPTVRQWRSRRYLTPVGLNADRLLLFRPDDVRAADEKARSCPAGRPRKDKKAA